MQTKFRLRNEFAAILLLSCTLSAAMAQPRDSQRKARQILNSTGVKGGLIVHIGCGDGRLTAALRTNESCIVHGLDTDAKNVEKARETIESEGVYGTVSVALLDGERLPYIDNLVNLVVADDLGGMPMSEVMRVLAPLGTAYIRGKKTVKPWPSQIDQWRQYLHDADNNAVAHDSVVGPPRHLQWIADPAWSRSHMGIPTIVSMVSSDGRLFSIEDRATVENPFLPGRWSLIARDAFNGVVLWRHAFEDFEPITRYVKDIAVQLQRRLAAIGDTVYCTPGLAAPIMAFDAATGRITGTYQGTHLTQEFAYDRGVLFAVIGDRMNAAAYDIVKTYSGKGVSLGGYDPNAPFGGTGFRGAYTRQAQDEPDPVCSIVAIEADSGAELWRIDNIHSYTGCSLAIKGQYAIYQTSGGLFCINPKTGARIWTINKDIQSRDGTEANTVVLSDSTVYAQEGKSFYAYSLKDGSQNWKAPIANNYEKTADLFLAAGAVWTGGSAQPRSYDIESGQETAMIPQRMKGPMGHDRCYRNFITDRYYINSKTGGADFLDLASKKEFPNHWTRGTCGMGVLPCNGLLYVPPYSCQCSIGAMVKNFNAFYTERGLKSPDQPIKIERQARLIKGPAFAQIENRKSKVENSTPWPTYRRDGKRSGVTSSKVPSKLTSLWKAEFRTVPSMPVVAEDKVFVSDIDAHTVCALDASSGKPIWKYVAASRVDSPPTYYKGLVLFGSRDGWVHCIRASDGALAWRFKDLPDKLIGAFGQLESAWPICGSVLIKDDTLYFSAGRSSFLDGGIFLYALDPQTGQIKHSRQIYGPFDERTGSPAVENKGFRQDILVTDGRRLYLRHKAFADDLSDTTGGPHVLPSAGFLDGAPQHRTYWTVSPTGGFTGRTSVKPPHGDIRRQILL
ncbi:MAG: outer membrane protein assembly factor BamB family protein [Planctomycetota bacterium]|jgi:outer membrane protein assembly factor BamB